MNVAQRDELLIRIDERMKGLKDGDNGDIPEIRKHLEKLNSHVSSNRKSIWQNRTAILTLTALLAGAGILEWKDIIHLF